MILSVVDTVSNIINNVKIFIEDTFSFLPSEILAVLIASIAIILALYIYRLLR